MLYDRTRARAEAEKEAFRRRRVIVRIWASCLDNGESVGHASLEYKFNGHTYYVSFWPKDPKLHNVIVPCASKLIGHLHKDIELESRDPKYTFCFYTLDPEGMLEEFKRFYTTLNKGSSNGWCLLGPIWDKFDCTSESCASLVWRLLLAGGIRNLISSTDVSSMISRETEKTSVRAGAEIRKSNFREVSKESILATENAAFILITSPDGLKNVLLYAKAKELKQHLWTQAISFPEETTPEVETDNCEPNWLYFIALVALILSVLCIKFLHYEL